MNFLDKTQKRLKRRGQSIASQVKLLGKSSSKPKKKSKKKSATGKSDSAAGSPQADSQESTLTAVIPTYTRGLISSQAEGETPAAVRPARDPGKRQRIFIVSALIVLFVFGLKVWNRGDWSVGEVILVAAISAVLTYLGLIWAFRFEITRKGFLTVLPMPSLFVFGAVLFMEMFFFQRLERIYEGIIFGFLLVGFILVFTAVFLTANILNVSTLKRIPLLQVAQTASYAIMLFSAYFTAFFFISLGLNILVLLAVLLVLYSLAVFLHLSHFSISSSRVSWYAIGLGWGGMLVAAGLLLWPLNTMLVALFPTVIIYIGVGIVMHRVRKVMRPLVYLEYVALALLILGLILANAEWGIGGYLWG